MRDTVLFLDTTLRDGEQTPGVSFHLNDKVDFARALETLGVDMIEAGFAGASPGDFEAVRAVARTVKTGVCSLARCVEADIRAAADALKGAAKPRIHVFIATSPLHRAAKLNMTREQVLDAAVRSVRLARSLCADVEFSCEDATLLCPLHCSLNDGTVADVDAIEVAHGNSSAALMFQRQRRQR